MELETLNATFVIDTFLLLLIGIGPKIALVPFLETTGQMPEATQRRVLRKMLTTAATVAVLLLILGGLGPGCCTSPPAPWAWPAGSSCSSSRSPWSSGHATGTAKATRPKTGTRCRSPSSR